MLLLALFIGIPLIEIALFIQLGSVLDLGWILLIVVLTAILGTWLVRRQGQGVLRQLQGSLGGLSDPTEPIAHGAMILFSGALLLTPGFFTDTVGFLLLVPVIREAVIRYARTRMAVRAETHFTMHGRTSGQPHAGAGPTHRSSTDVIDGEYEEVKPSEPPAGPSGTAPKRRSKWTDS